MLLCLNATSAQSGPAGGPPTALGLPLGDVIPPRGRRASGYVVALTRIEVVHRGTGYREEATVYRDPVSGEGRRREGEGEREVELVDVLCRIQQELEGLVPHQTPHPGGAASHVVGLVRCEGPGTGKRPRRRTEVVVCPVGLGIRPARGQLVGCFRAGHGVVALDVVAVAG